MGILHSNWFLCWIPLFSSSTFGYNLDTKFPIVFQINGSQDSYFGFAVGLLRSKDGYKALITAPRANSTVFTKVMRLHQPGALFSCNISEAVNTSSCDEVPVDTEGNSIVYTHNANYKNKRDDMWLGVSLDIQHSTQDRNVVVCGHLWKNQIQNNAYYLNGACYVMDSDLDSAKVEKLLPFVESIKSPYSNDSYYDGGQAGASAAFSEDGQFLLLGSPGFNSWAGTIISYKLNQGSGGDDLAGSPIITDTRMQARKAKYLGYSITSGKFFSHNIVFTAVGAPRDGNFRGKVYIVYPLSYEFQGFDIYDTKEGEQFGEYFGASINGIDINGDGLTDLFVGAPFHSEDNGGDEGKVYIYMGSKKDSFAEVPPIFGQKKENARFGTCIGNTGDLNRDGFNDVAIGAPYEDVNGAVYIYHGSLQGLKTSYIQRISAADLKGTVLSGFGISISRGLDIDNNSYTDLLIGSYATSNAVLLRTSPVINLLSKLEFDPGTINRNVTSCSCGGKDLACFNVTYCVGYTGINVPSSLVLKTELKMDTHRRRSTASRRGFLVCDGRNRASVSQQMSPNEGPNLVCSEETAYIDENVRDQITPVTFVMSYDLDPDNMPICQNDSFSKYCPVVDPSSLKSTTKKIYFLTECGNNDTCSADLSVKAHVVGALEGKALLIGESTTLTIDVTVRNSGDLAYSTELSIVLPPDTALEKHELCDVDSTEEKQYDNTTSRCDLGSVKKGEEAKIQVVVDVKNIPVSTKLLHICFRTSSVSEETDPSDNMFCLSVNFDAAANVNITGNPEDEQIPCGEEKSTARVIHKYYVRYSGPSPVEEIDIYLRVPTAVKEQKFLNLTGLEFDGEIATKCNDSIQKDGQVKPAYNFNAPYGNDTAVANLRSAHQIRKRSTGESTAVSSTKRPGDHILDCHEASCEVIHCISGPFVSGQKSIKITLSAEINVAVLSRAMGTWNSIKFITEGEIFMRGVRMLTENCRNKTTVETVIVRRGPSPPEQIAKWIIFVSIGVGILLLLIISFALIKIGFFKRKQRDNMKRMMHEARVNELKPQTTDGATGETNYGVTEDMSDGATG